MSVVDLRSGTAGWNIPVQQSEFGGTGSHLQRYAGVFNATEINSSFHRSHKPGTYARWAESVPPGFRFSVKLPREITHERRLAGTATLIDGFLDPVRNLGDRLGPLLIQLPPSLAFEEDLARSFFETLRDRFEGGLACEPRHPSWFGEPAEAALLSARIARVAADPARVPEASRPGGWTGLAYRRLHGSPRLYSSAYSMTQVDSVAHEMRTEAGEGKPSWCIFDNTMQGEAVRNALQLRAALA